MSKEKFSRDRDKRKKNEIPEELKEQLRVEATGGSINTESDNMEPTPTKPAKRRPGRPKGSKNSELQKSIARKNMTEYHRKVKEGTYVKSPWTKHGAYSFLQTKELPKGKEHLVKFASQERYKWIDQMGGEDSLSFIELSLIDEAARMLLYCSMITDYLMKKEDEEIVYKDKETGELKMHGALSRNYISFGKTYVNILKELNKMRRKTKGQLKKEKGVGDSDDIGDLLKSTSNLGLS